MMTPDEWDRFETFTINGMPFIGYALSDRDGVRFDMTQHDPTIRAAVSQADWLAVTSSPVNNAKVDSIERGFTVLIGFGKPSEPCGNLQFIRLRTRVGFKPARLAKLISLVLAQLVQLGIKLDKKMENTIRLN